MIKIENELDVEETSLNPDADLNNENDDETPYYVKGYN